jgi:hypothetical protein
MTKVDAPPVRLRLSNDLYPSRQWRVIEGVLSYAEDFGPTPVFSQDTTPDGNFVIVSFQMTPVQRENFLGSFGDVIGFAQG